MPKKTISVLTDDLDGKELPEDTQAVNLSLGRTTYALYLSEKNHGKLLEALNPFIEDAETVDNTPAARRTAATSAGNSAAEREENAKVRAWALETGFEYPGIDGNMRTLGERGRIPQMVKDAWKEAGSPEIPAKS